MYFPSNDSKQRSLLRIGNLTDKEATILITGDDDQGSDSNEVMTGIAPFATITLDADELETGSSDLNGNIGRGQGNWRLSVSSADAIFVMSLAESPSGRLVNLSLLTTEQFSNIDVLCAVPAKNAAGQHGSGFDVESSL